MSEENKAILQRWFEEIWNQGNAQAIDELATADLVIHGLTNNSGEPVTNVAEFKEFHKGLRNAFQNINVTTEDVIAEGDKVVARCRVTGSQTGELLGNPATNATIDFGGTAIARVSNGKIVEAWNNFDFLTMSKQLGMI